MRLQLIYFSPTGTSRKIVHAVATGFAAKEVAIVDLTRNRRQEQKRFSDGVAIIGCPVYAGRVPEVCLKRMAGFSANGIPAVLVGLYGNREYEDALVELRDVVTASGFNVVAAGAFIGEHSYSTAEQPIATGRPDLSDLKKAEAFGRQIAEKLAAGDVGGELAIAGNIPYRERPPLGGIAPETNAATCTLCGTCAKACPTFVISVGSEVVTCAENCVMCCACVRQCSSGARRMLHPLLQERREMLIQNCNQRKEPELFL